MYLSSENRFSDMTFIDNHKGFSANTAGFSGTRTVRIENIHFFGEMENDDCPDNNPCYCKDKHALMIPTTNAGAKPLHPDMPSQLPIHKVKSEGAWGGQVFLSNLRFTNFKRDLNCGQGRKQVLFERNPTASDYIPMATFENTVFENVEERAVAWL